MKRNKSLLRISAVLLTSLMLLAAQPVSAGAEVNYFVNPNSPYVGTIAECPGSMSGKHSWSNWAVTKKATCTVSGKKQRKCSYCGKTETKSISKKEHTWGAWTVIEEPGEDTAGTREHRCSVCGETQRESFYPEGTLKRGDRGDRVRELQEKLNLAGFDCGKPDGIFGKNTEAAVSGLQKKHGRNPDGIVWPHVWKLLDEPEVIPEPEATQAPDEWAAAYSATLTSYTVTDASGKDLKMYETDTTPGCKIRYTIRLYKYRTNGDDMRDSDPPVLYNVQASHPLYGGAEGAPIDIIPETEFEFGWPTVSDSDRTTRMSADVSTGAYEYFTFQHTLTAAEIASGRLATQAEITWTDEDGAPGSVTTNTDVALISAAGVLEQGKSEMVFTQTILSEPQNGVFYQEGEPIMIRYDVSCIREQDCDFNWASIDNLNIYSVQNDDRSVRLGSSGNPEYGGTASAYCEHIVTEEDVARGTFTVYGRLSCIDSEYALYGKITKETGSAMLMTGTGDGYEEGAKTMVLTGDTMVYAQPLAGRAIACLSAGTMVKVLKVSGNWLRISYGSRTGYIHASDKALSEQSGTCPNCGERYLGRLSCRQCGRCQYCDPGFSEPLRVCSSCLSEWEPGAAEASLEAVEVITQYEIWIPAEDEEADPIDGMHIVGIRFFENGTFTLDIWEGDDPADWNNYSVLTGNWIVYNGVVSLKLPGTQTLYTCELVEDGRIRIGNETESVILRI